VEWLFAKTWITFKYPLRINRRMNLLWLLPLVFLLPVIPLYIVVKILGGEITFLKAIGVKLAGLILAIIGSFVLGGLGPIIITVLMIIVYKMAFHLGVFRAIIAWILETVVMVGLVILMIVFLGLSLAGVIPGFTG
jgi:hypothetical protein